MWYERHCALHKSKSLLWMLFLPKCVGKEWSSSLCWVNVSRNWCRVTSWVYAWWKQTTPSLPRRNPWWSNILPPNKSSWIPLVALDLHTWPLVSKMLNRNLFTYGTPFQPCSIIHNLHERLDQIMHCGIAYASHLIVGLLDPLVCIVFTKLYIGISIRSSIDISCELHRGWIREQHNIH